LLLVYILNSLFQNSKYLVSKNSSSDQKYGSVRGNGTSYPSPGRGSPSRDRSYSSKSSYHSQKSHRDKERDSRDYKSRNSDKYSGKIYWIALFMIIKSWYKIPLTILAIHIIFKCRNVNQV